MRFAFAGLFAIALTWVAAASAAESSSPNAADEQAIRHVSDDYCAAFSKGDAALLLTYWTPDAEYIDTDGESVQGQADLAKYFGEALAELSGHTLTVDITSLRFIKPDLALEDGVAEVVSPEGEKTSGRYTAVWVKNDGNWQLARVHDLPGELDEDADDEIN